MKNLPFVLICFLIYSCGGNQGSEKEATINTELTYSFDTVMVDAGDEFLYLNDRLYVSDLSSDEKYLFNWNSNNTTLEQIDLDELKLVKTTNFEKEGPNGVGAFVSNYAITADGNNLFLAYPKNGIWDENGKLIRSFPIDKILENTEFTEDVMLSLLTPIPNEKNQFLAIYSRYKSSEFHLLIFDFSDDSFIEVDFPDLSRLAEFQVNIMYDGQWGGSFNTGGVPTVYDDKVILGMSSFNEAYIYDMVQDTLYLKSWDGPLVGRKKTVQLPKEVEGETPELWETVRKAQEDIGYGGFIWDKQKNQYFRLSLKRSFGEEKSESGRYIPTGTEVFLSVFDGEMNLISEIFVPEFKDPPGKHFVKDGKIWFFENVDDELAFVRMTLN